MTNTPQHPVTPLNNQTYPSLVELLPDTWKFPELISILQSPQFRQLEEDLKHLDQLHKLRPEYKNIFNALNHTAPDQIKVVILGQDPYPKDGDAIGMSFAVNPNHPIPRSLANMYKELYDDLGIDNRKTHGDLTKWAKQGVLLLNTTLTTETGVSNAHRNTVWSAFTTAIIHKINEIASNKQPIMYLLWGNDAKEKGLLIHSPFIQKVESPHPSPFSARRGFFGSKPFSQTNNYLISNNQTPIDWQL